MRALKFAIVTAASACAVSLSACGVAAAPARPARRGAGGGTLGRPRSGPPGSRVR